MTPENDFFGLAAEEDTNVKRVSDIDEAGFNLENKKRAQPTEINAEDPAEPPEKGISAPETAQVEELEQEDVKGETGPVLPEAGVDLAPAAEVLPYKIETITSQLLEIRIEPRVYSIMGFQLKKLGAMGVTVKVEGPTHEGPSGFHLGEVNLAKSKSRADWLTDARDTVIIPEETLKRDLLILSQAIETLQRENLKRLEEEKSSFKQIFTYAPNEEAKARRWLSNKDFTETLFSDLDKLGYVGDTTGKAVLYIAASSRKLQKPISVLSISKSGAGKSHSHQVISSLLPSDEKYSFTRISSKAFSNFRPMALRGKSLFLDEFSGAEGEATPIRSLLSRGYLTIAIPSLDTTTGQVETIERVVYGPMNLFASTCDANLVGDELMNRLIALSVPYSVDQTREIMKVITARGTKRGILLDGERKKIQRQYQVAQKILRPVTVALPGNLGISGLLDGVTEIRRFNNFLDFVKATAFLRQYQRPILKERDPVTGENLEIVEATTEDVHLAKSLLGKVFLSSNDELSPLDKRLLEDCQNYCLDYAKKRGIPVSEVNFSRRDIRTWGSWQMETSKRAFLKLIETEGIIKVSGKERTKNYYRLAKELLPDG